MLTSSPQEQFEELKTQLLSQISKTFPITDRHGKVEVRVNNLRVEDQLGVNDIKSQFDARVKGKSWAAPVLGDIEIVDTTTGKPLVSKTNVQIAKIPKLTRHFSYIVGGQEKTLANQWRLRPGAYVKSTEKEGEYEAQFQAAGGRFDIHQDKDTGYIYMKMGSRKIPLYSVLQSYGVSDDDMRKAWGDESFKASKAKSKPDKDLASLHKAWRGEDMPSGLDPKVRVHELFAGTRVDPGVLKANLGVAKDSVDGDVLLRASRKLVDVTAQRAQPDPIDSLRYKELWTAKDHLSERIAQSATEITRRVQSALGKPKVQSRLQRGDASVLRDVVMPDLIQRPMYHAFATPLAINGKQTNPITMLSDHSLVTIMGPGGIQNRYAITKSNTSIDPSHLGYVDPVFTPESDPGVNTHLAVGVKIKDRKPLTRMYNLRTKKLEDVDAVTAAAANVVFPDQVRFSKGHPVPIGKTIRMSDKSGTIRDDVPWSQADYVMIQPSQVFAAETNLVPFMQNDSAGRTTMSARHMGQAISIVGREAPKVQVEAGAGHSFEELLGHNLLAHKSPVSGTVVSVKPDEIIVKDKAGKQHPVHLYNHYPTNHDKGELHSTPLVKPGQTVAAGQIVADHNFSKRGVLALGTNLRTAYLANGTNHEDGLVISESAAKKLASEHLYKPSLFVGKTMQVDKSKFVHHKENLYLPGQVAKIDASGIVKPGTVVEPGDPLILALNADTKPHSITAKTAIRLSKRARSAFENSSLTWDGDYPGEVVRVERAGDTISVHVRTKEPAQIGSKLSTRHSAKGIVAGILPDSEMPHDVKGRSVDMLLNPVSVPGRQNPGQILETAAGKIAEKTGKPYLVKNFAPGTDYLKKLKGELAQHGISDTETLIDPKTGRRLGEIMVGPHYVFQLEHQVDKKTHMRSGGYAPPGTGAPKLIYDSDTRIPRGGGHEGAQSLGSLGTYGALAAGLRNNLHEMSTLKSDRDQAMELWGAITNSMPIPPPQTPWVSKKFEAMLRGLGVNVEKVGSQIRVVPQTSDEVRAMSRGALKRPSAAVRVRTKDDVPEKGGIFDPTMTGGMEGEHWTHIELAEPMPNPVYAKAIALTLGLDARQPHNSIKEVLAGEKSLPGHGSGPKAIYQALAKLDLDEEIKKTRAALDDPKLKESALDKMYYRYQALKMLKAHGKKPKDVWTTNVVPVLPPVFRMQATLPDGTIKNNPLNQLYRKLGTINESLQRGEKKVPYNNTLDTRTGLYQAMSDLYGTVPKGKKALDLDPSDRKEVAKRKLPGILHMISGEHPKDGFFQDKMIGKKQDYTARGTIVADPNLSMDEIGLPKKVAMELMRPFVARRLQAAGLSGQDAHTAISKKSAVAVRALEREIEERPVIMKRDPVLHQYGMLGQKIRLIDSPAIKVSPLVLPPIGGDVDGDTVSLFVPVTQPAVEEVRRIMPSVRTLSDSSGTALFTPTNESALALYRSSLPRSHKNLTFKDLASAEQALSTNKLDLSDVVTIAGTKTTLGRARMAQIVPEKYKKTILEDLEKPVDRKLQSQMLQDVARNQPKDFLGLADKITRLGFKMAYESGHTVGLKDLEPLRHDRDAIIQAARKEVAKLKPGSEAATEKWLDATRKIHDLYNKHYEKHPTNISDMALSGIKAKTEQFQGLVMAPMLVEDHLGRPSAVPITKSFAEGLDVGGYFLQASGARRGVVQKTESVKEPGYMTKLLVQENIDQPITSMDCGTSQGVMMSIRDRDVVDRFLAHPITVGGKTIPAGAAVTPSLLDAISKGKDRVDQLMVRSPLKCRMPHGICAKCMGAHPSGNPYRMGENVGVISAQALGERAAQLMLRQTHGGGIVSVKGPSVEQFSEVEQLFNMAEPSAVSAHLAAQAGTVSKIDGDRRGGWNLHLQLGTRNKVIHSAQKPLVARGHQFQKGDQLTAGEPNLRDLLKTRGLDAVQQHMSKKVGDIYAKEGVLRRHAELAVRHATSLVRVTDPGSHDSIVRGDYLMKQVADELNNTVLKNRTPIRYQSELVSMSQMPLRRQKDFIARLQGENLSQSLVTAIQHGHRSDLAGLHPVPALAFGAPINPLIEPAPKR